MNGQDTFADVDTVTGIYQKIVESVLIDFSFSGEVLLKLWKRVFELEHHV
jgi:hypothetical protein